MAGENNDVRTSRRIQVPCASCPLRQSKAFRAFTPEELRFVETFKIGEMNVGAGRALLEEGAKADHLFTLLSGWAMKFKSLEDGRRQIINYALPGDFIGLQGSVHDRMDYSVETLSDVLLCVFSKERIWALYRDHPGLAHDMTWMVAHEKAILGDFLLTVGQRTARERIAFVLLSIFRRARSVGLVDRRGNLALPITQQHISDTIGFSLVHTNKTLNSMKRLGAFTWAGTTLRVIDEAALQQLAGEEAREVGLRPFI